MSSVREFISAVGTFPYRGWLRIYLGREGDAVVLLLVGGSKASQVRDIRLARAYWREYQGGK